MTAAAKPTDSEAAERFVNRRAQAYWHLHNQLEAGKLALPRAWADDLTRELQATNWAPTGTGKVLIESKADIKAKLSGASPDVADSLSVALASGGIRFLAKASG